MAFGPTARPRSERDAAAEPPTPEPGRSRAGSRASQARDRGRPAGLRRSDDAFPRVFAFILKRIGDRAEAEDLTQETFVQLYRSLGSFEGRSSLLTWTFGIAHNVCSRYYRHCSRWMVGPKDARTLEERPVEAAVEQQVDAAAR
ncbi:MAG: sigma-70 family RNA polymerase sigma factor [Myxococcota bacterium]